jgi:hypothetical protein
MEGSERPIRCRHTEGLLWDACQKWPLWRPNWPISVSKAQDRLDDLITLDNNVQVTAGKAEIWRTIKHTLVRR